MSDKWKSSYWIAGQHAEAPLPRPKEVKTKKWELRSSHAHETRSRYTHPAVRWHAWCWSDRLVSTIRLDSSTGKIFVEITWRFSAVQVELARVGASDSRYRERSMSTSIELYRRSTSSRIPFRRNRKRNCCRQRNESRVLVLLAFQGLRNSKSARQCRRWTTEAEQITSRYYVYNDSGAIYVHLPCT